MNRRPNLDGKDDRTRYSTHEIARYLKITEKAVYRHMDRLKEKVKKIFE